MGGDGNLYWPSVLTRTIRSLWAETSPDKAIARAQRYVEKGRHDSAAGVLRDALEAGGEELSMRMELSRILIASNEVKEASEGLKSFLKAHPGEAHQVRDLLAWARANHHEARALNEVLAEHHVGRREFRPAFEALENLEKETLSSLLDARLAHLNRFMEKKPEALPRSALPLIYLSALIHEALGEDPRAVEVYHRIVSAYPKEITAIEERLKGITARHYKSASLRGALAGIYAAAGQPDKAVDEYVMMAEVDPRAADAAADGVRSLSIGEDAGDGPPVRALMGLVKVLRTGGKIEPLFDACSDLLSKGAAPPELLGVLEGLVAESGADPRLHLLVGEAAARTGKVVKSVAAFAVALENGDPQTRDRAVAALERLQEANPAESGVAEVLADHAIRSGRLDDAVACMARVPVGEKSASSIASRLQTILMTRPDHEGACFLLEKVSPLMDDPQMAALFLRRRLRESPARAREALESIGALQARVPQDPMIRMASIEAKAACGDMAGAWEALRGVLDGTTGPDPALFHLMVFIGSSSRELCREVTESFTSMAPALADTPEGQFCLGEMAARSGDADGAIEAFRSAAAFSPAATAEVVTAARELCGPALTGKAAASLAGLLVDAGDFSGASTLLGSLEGLGAASGPLLDRIEKAYRKQPDNPDLRLALASALAAAGRTGHARQLIDEGIQKAGASAPGSLHLAAGDAWIRDGNLGEAVRSYSRAMAQDKSLAHDATVRLDKVLLMDVGHAGAHLARGRGLLLDGNPREGVNSLLTAWSIRPALGEAILKDLSYAARSFPLEPSVDLARAQITLGQGEVESATVALGSALKSAPSMAPEVLSRLQAIIRSHPSCAPARLHAARAWQLRGRYREAGQEYLAAFELDKRLVDHVATGLAELLHRFPEKPEPFVSRARFEEARGNHSMAAESWEAAAFLGAEAGEACGALERLALSGGPHQGRALLAMGRAAHHLGRHAEAASAVERAAALSPELLAEARSTVERMVSERPGEPDLRMARVRLLQMALEPEAAIEDLEVILESAPDRWRDVDLGGAASAEQGADGGRCALIRARAMCAGGSFDEAAGLLGAWSTRAKVDLRGRMFILMSRIERRRGDVESAKRWMAQAAGLAGDAERFVSSLHDETRAAALVAARLTGGPADRWKALRAMLDLGDAAGAERLAEEMSLTASGTDRSPAESVAAREILARIACLKGRHDESARLLAQAPPSSLKSHVLRRAGRLVEAAACVEDLGDDSGHPGAPAGSVYRRLAAREFLGEPGCLEAETTIDFMPAAAAAAQETAES
jgi:tetratricopeptide (TPR) repeat protein